MCVVSDNVDAPLLQALELSQVDYTGEDAKVLALEVQRRQRAAQQFQGTLIALKLTSLRVINVDFVADDCHQVLPERDAGSLAELR